MKIYLYLLCAVCVVFLGACRHNPLKVNISSIKEEVPLVRYDQLFFEAASQSDTAAISGLREKYPQFTDLFSYQVIKIGTLSDSAGRKMAYDFVSDSVIRQAKMKSDELFPEHPAFHKDLIRAFRHYRYYFPEKELPEIYACISGFNESVFISGNMVGISLDKYLGSDCEFYPLLGIPMYKQRKMISALIPADVIHAWGRSRFPLGKNATTLCDYMIYEGRLLYFMQALSPEMPDSLITGFSALQSEWCDENQSEMWNYIVENKLLFSSKQMDIVRYINDGPTTNGFPKESPGRTGAWLGWQIVKKYMKNNPEVTLPELMANDNYQGILNASAYAP